MKNEYIKVMEDYEADLRAAGKLKKNARLQVWRSGDIALVFGVLPVTAYKWMKEGKLQEITTETHGSSYVGRFIRRERLVEYFRSLDVKTEDKEVRGWEARMMKKALALADLKQVG